MSLPEGLNKNLSRFEILLLSGVFLGILLLVLGLQIRRVSFSVNIPSSLPAIETEEFSAEKTEDLKGKFFLTPEEGNFGVGQVFKVGVWAETGGLETDAADVEIIYDPEILLILNLKKGDIFDEYPEMSFDDQEGTIAIRGIDLPQKTFIGNGKIGEITFRTKKTGKTSLEFNFEPGQTTDSNLVESGTAEDILGIAKGSSFVIN